MWAKGLSGRRFFGRVVRAELACPSCNRVVVLKPGRKKIWESRLSRMTCPGCMGRWYVGLLAWRVVKDPKAAVPPDHVPDPAQSKALVQETRAQYRNLEPPHRRRRGEQANIVIGGGPETEGD